MRYADRLPDVPSSEPDQTRDLRSEFERHRRRLWGVAYRMLGSRAEAEDMLQEAYLRWHQAARDEIRSPQAWLVTTVTRLCIDRMRQLRVERDAYVGPWLPEPLVGSTAAPTDRASELASDLSLAFLALLERLAPEERAAFLLHDVFDSEYGDIAAILGKSETACRQIVTRARRRVRDERPRVEVTPGARDRLIDAFARALQAGDRETLLGLFAGDATWTSDGGGKVFAARRSLRGRDLIVRAVLGFRRHWPLGLEVRQVLVNGEPGLALVSGGQVGSVLSIRTDGERILDVFGVLNPDKLRAIAIDGEP
jgi:RNA polymerase sigma-70 factor, ECF subfamily